MGSLFIILPLYSASSLQYHRFEYLVISSLLYEENNKYIASGVFPDGMNGSNQKSDFTVLQSLFLNSK